MKNFKQVLALVVVFTLMISSVAMAAIPADVVGTDYEEAAIRLGALGIMIGDEGGFRTEDAVKRSEMAKITVMMIGSDAAAKAATGNTVFSDVAADHWASGYVNVASSLGLVIGNGDGTFAPDADVTNAQAITMIMRALNYESYASDNGGYPTGFVVAATNAEVLEGVDDIDLNKAATRGTIALLVNNALEAPMMVQTTYGNGSKEYVISGQNNVAESTILIDKLKLTKFNGTISKIDTEKGRVTLAAGVQQVTSDDQVVTENKKTLPSEIKYSADLTLGSELKELEINFWVDKDNVMICYGMPEETDIIYGYIKSVNEYTDTQMNSKTYAFEVADGDNTTELIESVELSNGVSYSFTEEEAKAVALYAFADDVEPKYSGTTVSNTTDLSNADAAINVYMPVKVAVQDGKITKIGFFDYTGMAGIVYEASETAVRASANGLSTGSGKKSYTKLDEAESVLVIKDGVAGASLSDIAPGMYVMGTSWLESGADENSYIIIVSSESVTGKFSKKANNSITVAGEVLRFATPSIPVSIDGGATFENENIEGANLTSLLQGEITVVKNLVGKAVAIIGTSTSSRTVYGLVDRVYTTNGDETVSVFVIEDGAIVKRNYGLTSTGTEPDTTLAATYSRRAIDKQEYNTYADEAAKLEAYAKNGYFKFTLNADNEIKAIEQQVGILTIGGEKGDSAGTADGVVFNILSSSISYDDGTLDGFASVQSSTKFFDIKDCFDDAAAPTLVDYSALVGKDLNSSFGISLVKDGTKLLAGILTNGTSGLTADDVKFGLVTELATTNEDILTVTLMTSEGTIVKDVDIDDIDTNVVVVGAVVAYEDYSEASMNIRGVGDKTATTLTSFNGLSDGKKIDFKQISVLVDQTFLDELDRYSDDDVMIVGGNQYSPATNVVVLEYNENTDKYVSRDISTLDVGDNAYVVVNDYDSQYVMIVID